MSAKTNMNILDEMLSAVADVEIQDHSELKNLIRAYADPDILAEMKKGAPLTGPQGLRRKLGARNLEFFGRAYLPHYFVRATPDFHRELDALWMEGVCKGIIPDTKENCRKIARAPGNRRATAAPRGHAKSTTFTFKGTLHASCYGYKHYPIILSDSSDQATSFLDGIRVEIEENEAIREDFGELKGRVWKTEVLITSTGIKIEAIGSGKKIRGRKHKNWRPDLLVLDDIENDEMVRTPEQRRKLADWFWKAVSKAGDTYTDIIYIGTLLHYDSLLANILKNPGYKSRKYQAVIRFAERMDLWDQWIKIYTDLDNGAREENARQFFEDHKDEMLQGTQVLWEAKLSYYDLMVIKVSEGEASFNSELQNEPINPDDCLFSEEWLDYYNEAELDFKEKRYIFIGFVDPSLGKNKKADTSAIITLAQDRKTGYMYVLVADIERRKPDRIIRDVIDLEKRLRRDYGRGFKKLGCETNQFQAFFKDQMAVASAREGIYLPLEEVNQKSDKVMRIETLQPDIKNGYIKFNRRHKKFLEQLLQFPMAAHDDGPDALEGARTLAKKKRSIADAWR